MNAIDFNNYLFRCSSLGKLMTGIKEPLTQKQAETLIGLQEKVQAGKVTDKQLITLGQLIEKRDAKPELSATTKTYLETIHREEVMRRSKNIQTKYTEKGTIVEEKSISLYTDVYGKLLVKNKARFKDQYITGEPDNVQGIVRDFKSSYDFTTFPMYKNEIPNLDYEWQLQGYMDLTGKDESELIYCLIDTPIKIIESEIFSLDRKENILDLEGNIREDHIQLVVEKIQSLIYTEEGLEELCNSSSFIQKEWFTDFFELPKELRIKVFHLQKDQVKLEMLHEQIARGREFLNDLTITMANALLVTA